MIDKYTIMTNSQHYNAKIHYFLLQCRTFRGGKTFFLGKKKSQMQVYGVLDNMRIISISFVLFLDKLKSCLQKVLKRKQMVRPVNDKA